MTSNGSGIKLARKIKPSPPSVIEIVRRKRRSTSPFQASGKNRLSKETKGSAESPVSHLCVICGNDYFPKEAKIYYPYLSGREILNQNLRIYDEYTIYFVLHDLFQVPEEKCDLVFEELIRGVGEPGKWGVSFCERHKDSIKDAFEIFHLTAKLREEFSKLQNSLKNDLRHSLQDHKNRSLNSYLNLRSTLKQYGNLSEKQNTAQFENLEKENRRKKSRLHKQARHSDCEIIISGSENYSSPEKIPSDNSPTTDDLDKSINHNSTRRRQKTNDSIRNSMLSKSSASNVVDDTNESINLRDSGHFDENVSLESGTPSNLEMKYDANEADEVIVIETKSRITNKSDVSFRKSVESHTCERVSSTFSSPRPSPTVLPSQHPEAPTESSDDTSTSSSSSDSDMDGENVMTQEIVRPQNNRSTQDAVTNSSTTPQLQNSHNEYFRSPIISSKDIGNRPRHNISNRGSMIHPPQEPVPPQYLRSSPPTPATLYAPHSTPTFRPPEISSQRSGSSFFRPVDVGQQEHRNENSYQGTFRNINCPYCTNTYAGKYGLNLHLKTVHGIEDSNPNPSFKGFGGHIHFEKSNSVYLRREVSTKMSLTCRQCGKRLSSKKTLTNHLKTQHWKQFKFICHICQTGCLYRSKFEIHMRNVHGKGIGKSGGSKLPSSTRESRLNPTAEIQSKLQEMVKTAHNFVCHHCGEEFEKAIDINRHKKRCSFIAF